MDLKAIFGLEVPLFSGLRSVIGTVRGSGSIVMNVLGLQHPAFLAGGHAPGKSSSIRLFQLGIGLEAMVCGHGGVSSWGSGSS